MSADTKSRRIPSRAREEKVQDKMVDAAFALAEREGWAGLSIARIAEEADVPLAEALAVTPSKTAILAAFSRRIDVEVLAGLDEELDDEPARDRLFDVLMSRYDAMAPYKPAIRAIARDLSRDWTRFAASIGPALESIGWMLEAADLDTSGLRGAARVRAVAVIYAANLRVWLDEESGDLAKTMADLDRRLRRTEEMIDRVRGFIGQLRGIGRGARAGGDEDV